MTETSRLPRPSAPRTRAGPDSVPHAPRILRFRRVQDRDGITIGHLCRESGVTRALALFPSSASNGRYARHISDGQAGNWLPETDAETKYGMEKVTEKLTEKLGALCHGARGEAMGRSQQLDEFLDGELRIAKNGAQQRFLNRPAVMNRDHSSCLCPRTGSPSARSETEVWALVTRVQERQP